MLFIKTAYIIYLTFLSIISVNHILGMTEILSFSSRAMGWFGFSGLLLSCMLVGWHYLKQAGFVFLLFFVFGALKGPFLEPPSDPLDHLANAHRLCQMAPFEQKDKLNRGFWHYSMTSRALCQGETPLMSYPQKLRRIFIGHGFFMAAGLTAVFILSRSAGLSGGWALLSTLLCLLFMGTNRFSYFTYYSLGPSMSSITILWLWTAAFFFKTKLKDILFGLGVALLCLPIVMVNHLQEAVFLCLIVFWWLLINSVHLLWRHSEGHRSIRLVMVLSLLALFFILPQFQWFQSLLEQGFIYRNWEKNQALAVSWQGLHLMGKVWSFRVNDTLGLMGFAPVLLSAVYLLPQMRARSDSGGNIRIIILALMPLLVYCTPLLNFVWVSNCVHKATHIRYYYRMGYISMSWLLIAHCLYHMSLWARSKFARDRTGVALTVNTSGPEATSPMGAVAVFCILLAFGLSTIRSGPVYGKLDFILVDSLDWWDEWRPMIDTIEHEPDKPILTDPLTRKVINGFLGQPLLKRKLRTRRERLDIYELEQWLQIRDGSVRCLINLHSITPTWVPSETHHWPSRAAGVILYYRVQGQKGDRMIESLKKAPPQFCRVYF